MDIQQPSDIFKASRDAKQHPRQPDGRYRAPRREVPDVAVSSDAGSGTVYVALSGGGLVLDAELDVDQATVLRDMLTDCIEHVQAGGHAVT